MCFGGLRLDGLHLVVDKHTEIVVFSARNVLSGSKDDPDTQGEVMPCLTSPFFQPGLFFWHRAMGLKRGGGSRCS